MRIADNNGLVDLSIFSLGIAYLLYWLLQYLFTPICWLLAQTFDFFSGFNDVFFIFERQGLEVFTAQSISYSIAGLVSFFVGYQSLPAKSARLNSSVAQKAWSYQRAEQIFWLLIFAGFSIKLLKIMLGINIAEAVYMDRNIFKNPMAAFFLSLNWFHLIALVVINVAYREARNEGHHAGSRLKFIAYATSFFVIAAAMTTGSKLGIFSPIIALLIIRQFYTHHYIPPYKYLLLVGSLIVVTLAGQYVISWMTASVESFQREDESNSFVVLYLTFFRLNLSYIVAAVIDVGQQAFPNGTLGQFWVDMSFYGIDKTNVFDGNDFGRFIGAAASEDDRTGIAVTNIGDLFINYDIYGIVIGMAVTGGLYKLILSNCQWRAPFFVMLYALTWPILIHGMESPITVLYSTTIKMVSLCFVVHLAIIFQASGRQRSSSRFVRRLR